MQSNDSVVLIVTSGDEPTVPRVIEHLERIGQAHFRINVDSLIKSKSLISLGIESDSIRGGVFTGLDSYLDINRIKSVWFRRPGKPLAESVADPIERQFIEDEFSAVMWSLYTCLDGQAYWMNPPLYSRDLLEHNKLLQLKLARRVGLLVPNTLITNNPSELNEFCKENGGVIALKPVKSRLWDGPDGVAMGIYTQAVDIDAIKANSAAIAKAPVIAQSYVPKQVELRITIAGSSVMACEIHSQDSERTKHDWRRYDPGKVRHDKHMLPEAIRERLLAFMKACRLTYGAVDMILTPQGEYVFLEVNPSGQFIWIENLTGLPISASIAEALARA